MNVTYSANPYVNHPFGVFSNGTNFIDGYATVNGNSNSISSNFSVQQLAKNLIRGIGGNGVMIV